MINSCNETLKKGEKELVHRSSILKAESSRLAGTPTYSVDDVRAKLKEKYLNA